MMIAPPAGMVGAATATEHARARGVQHLELGTRHASPSALGTQVSQELSDDSLTMSPEKQRTQKRGAVKPHSPAFRQALGSITASPDATRVDLHT